MKFPEADEQGKKGGWDIDPKFLAATQDVLTYELSMEEIEVVLLAAQRIMEEQEKGFCEADYEPSQRVKAAFASGIEWGQEHPFSDDRCRQNEGLMEFWEKQENLNPDFSKTVDRLIEETGNPLWFAWHNENPFGLSK